MESNRPMRYLVIGLVGVLIIFSGLLLFWFVSNTQSNGTADLLLQRESNPTQSQSASPTAQNGVPEQGNSEAQSDPDGLPDDNTIYYGTMDGEEAIFITNANHQTYFEDGVERSDPSYGTVVTADGSGESSVPFQDFSQEYSIAVGVDRDITDVSNFLMEPESNTLYVSLILEPVAPAKVSDYGENRIYEIDMEITQSRVVWSTSLDESNQQYPAKGVAQLRSAASNRYIAFYKSECYACGSIVNPFNDMIILNTETGNEKYMEEIGTVELIPEENIFSYQELAMVEVPCENGPGCPTSGFRSEMQPTGPPLSEQLPE